MAGANIGPLTLKIIANADVMSGVLNKAAATTKRWAGSVAADMSKALSNPMGLVADKLKMIPKIGGALALPVEAISAGIGAVMGMYDEGAAKILDLGAASARTGVPMNDLKALMLAAGPASEMMDKSMFKLQQHVMDAARGSDKAKLAFEQLGISTKGIAEVKTIDLMKTLSDKFAALPNGAARASAAFALFGKNGLAMLPMLAAGSSRITKAQQRVDTFGLGANENDVANIRAAQDAKKTMGLFKEGVVNQVALGVAPILAELNSLMGSTGISAKGMSGYVIDGFEKVAKGIAWVYDAFKGFYLVGMTAWTGLKMGAISLGAVIADLGAGMLDVFDGIVKGIAKTALFMAKMPGGSAAVNALKTAGVDLKGMAENGMGLSGTSAAMKAAAQQGRWSVYQMKQNMLDEWGQPTAMDKVAAFFANVRALANKAGGAATNYWEALMLKWTPNIQEIQKQFDGPIGVFAEKVGQIQQMYREGIGNIIGNAFGQRAVGAQFQALVSGMNLPQKKFAGAAMQDSVEAFSAIVQHQFGDQNLSVQERMLQILQEQKARADDQIRIGQETLDAIRKDPTIFRGLQ